MDGSVGRSVDTKLASPKILAGAYARPGTGMHFGLAFMNAQAPNDQFSV